MNDHPCDVAIIGAGSAGLAAHAAARRHTNAPLLIEGKAHGTTCARVGCMPSKLLIAAADCRRHIDDAGLFGIRVPSSSVDGAAVMQRLRSLRDDFVAGVVDSVDKLPPQQRLQGLARFEGPATLRVGDIRVQARTIVIATGSTPIVPPPFRALGDRLLTTDTVFELPTLPASLAIVGGGFIGLELAQAFHALGVRTRLFHSGQRLGPQGDDSVSALATELFSRAVPCELGVQAAPRWHSDSEVELGWTSAAGKPLNERFEYVLVCAGRRPQLEGLDLARSGLALDARGVPLFDPATQRCGDSAIFIAGDCDGDRPLLHEAAREGRVAGENAARFPDVRALTRQTPLSIAFTEPQYASIGARLDELKPAEIAIGELRFTNQGRSRVIGRNAGIARLYGERRSGRLLGATLLGPAAEHLAHLLAWAVQQRLTVAQMLELPFYHPVVEEGLRTALKDLRDELQPAAASANESMDCGPGT